MSKKYKGPKILVLDIETAPIKALVWDIWEQNVGLNQILEDWSILAYCGLWVHNGKIVYKDQRRYKSEKSIRNDKKLVKSLWKLLDEADIIVTKNGKRFDEKKIKARFIQHGMTRPSPYKHIDIEQISRRNFGFTSHRLEYITDKINTEYKKQKSGGMETWIGCLNGELKSWQRMEEYNKHDTLSTAESFKIMYPWDNSIDFNTYSSETGVKCNCGSYELQRRGIETTRAGQFQRYQCKECGSWFRGKQNLMDKDKRKALLMRIT